MTLSGRPPPITNAYFRPSPISHTRASPSPCNTKTALKTHNVPPTAPAAHSKRLYRKCSGIRLAPQSNFICRSTSDRELTLIRHVAQFLWNNLTNYCVSLIVFQHFRSLLLTGLVDQQPRLLHPTLGWWLGLCLLLDP